MDQHHEKYGVSTIPLPPSSLEDDYRKLEAELLDENGSSSAEARRTKKAKTEESEELPKYPDNVDAKTLARLKVSRSVFMKSKFLSEGLLISPGEADYPSNKEFRLLTHHPHPRIVTKRKSLEKRRKRLSRECRQS